MNLNCHGTTLPLPKWLVPVHAGIAIRGFLLLVKVTNEHFDGKTTGASN